MDGYQRDGGFSLPMTFDTRPAIHTNTADFYKKLAESLRQKSTEGRWEKTDTVKVTIDGKEYTVGPFIDVDGEWYSNYVGFSFPGDDFAVAAGDSFDSWGYEEGYGPEVNFRAMKIVRYIPVYDEIDD